MVEELKYPYCEQCKFLFNMGVEAKTVNDYHEGKLPLSKLPKTAQRWLKRYWKKKGYVKDVEK